MDLAELKKRISGEVLSDSLTRTVYATDASAYKEIPTAICIPASTEDLAPIVAFAHANRMPIVPRTAGTSLAGQVVGNGVIIDVGKNLTNILELNVEEGWVEVEPGVIRDELNQFLEPHGYLFGPETSTANRAMIGGMIGNNSCGSNSVVYGSTRENLLSIQAVLSDGSEVEFTDVTPEEFQEKLQSRNKLEAQIYQNIHQLLSNPENREEIDAEFPKKEIPRRNTGYAVDLLKDTEPFGDFQQKFNFSTLIAGSEGTLAFIKTAKLKITPLPPKHSGLLCIHFDSVYESLLGNLKALEFGPSACELMDHYILECTKENIGQQENRFFVQGDPQAILVVELKRDSEELLKKDAERLVDVLKENKLGYHYPWVTGPDTSKVWNLRKAGLGLLSNIPGDAKPAPVIEDTAVDVKDLPEYIKEFNETLKKYDLFCVHYAHAGSGELHLRPILNLKTEEGNRLFKTIAEEIARLVKKYKGSLSGEHGDGRLRGEFIPFMIGEKNYALLKEIKKAWDPHQIFNPGKIVDSPAMNQQLRYAPGQDTPQFDTVLNFDRFEGILRSVEQCNGSGDCRKTEKSGGTMCPSYMATRDERDTTRARANVLREALSNPLQTGGFGNKEGKEILDLCLSCKGCKSECPSNVDMAKIKAEYMYQYYRKNGIPFRTRLMARFSSMYSLGSKMTRIANAVIGSKVTGSLLKSVAGIAPQRSLPLISATTVIQWFKKNYPSISPSEPIGELYLLVDEFTNFTDAHTGIAAIQLLTTLGYTVNIEGQDESGRTAISKSFLKEAQKSAIKNVMKYRDKISSKIPLVGLEPSALLSFRDEYIDLVPDKLREQAKSLAENCLTFEEFVAREWKNRRIDASRFSEEEREVIVHGHCHQKAISSVSHTKNILRIPKNYSVKVLNSGCCGMAGSFGYEKEHYDLSQKIGELVLLPAVRKAQADTLIVAAGTSCRHQIKDGASRKALHPAEVLLQALK